MPLYLPSDPPSGSQDFKPLGPPLRNSQGQEPTKPVYEKTSTPGVVVNKSTGMMETQIPVPPVPKLVETPAHPELFLDKTLKEKYQPVLDKLNADYIKKMLAKDAKKDLEVFQQMYLNKPTGAPLKGKRADMMIFDDLSPQDPYDFSEYESFVRKHSGKQTYNW